MRATSVRLAVMTVGLGLLLAYVLSVAFFVWGGLWIEARFGVLVLIAALIPGLVVCVLAAIVASAPIQLAGGWLIGVGLQGRGSTFELPADAFGQVFPTAVESQGSEG